MFTLYLPQDQALTLGGTIDVLKAFQTFGRLEPGDHYGRLHGVVNAAGQELHPTYAIEMRADAAAFLAKHRARLSSFEHELLCRLAALDYRS